MRKDVVDADVSHPSTRSCFSLLTERPVIAHLVTTTSSNARSKTAFNLPFLNNHHFRKKLTTRSK